MHIDKCPFYSTLSDLCSLLCIGPLAKTSENWPKTAKMDKSSLGEVGISSREMHNAQYRISREYQKGVVE